MFQFIAALNDDSWHSVDIFLETTSGKLEVTLDDLPSTSIYLRAYTQFADVKAILDWTRLRSVVSFAGEKKGKKCLLILIKWMNDYL